MKSAIANAIMPAPTAMPAIAPAGSVLEEAMFTVSIESDVIICLSVPSLDVEYNSLRALMVPVKIHAGVY